MASKEVMSLHEELLMQPGSPPVQLPRFGQYTLRPHTPAAQAEPCTYDEHGHTRGVWGWLA